MKAATAAAILMSALLSASPPVFAQGSGAIVNGVPIDQPPETPPPGGYRHRGWDPSRSYYDARGYEFRRGGHLPPQLRGRHYVVEDWRGHGLNRPPRGHQWVQVGADYVLVAVATGLIVQMVLNSR